MPLLPPPEHISQIGWGYCLPACVQMALAQLDLVATQKALAQLLGTQPGIGTPFSCIQQLQNVNVRIVAWCGLDMVSEALSRQTAVITAVMTTPELPGWQNSWSPHAVLVTEVQAALILYHDPALPHGPVSAAHNEFLLAWSEMAEQTAFISRK